MRALGVILNLTCRQTGMLDGKRWLVRGRFRWSNWKELPCNNENIAFVSNLAWNADLCYYLAVLALLMHLSDLTCAIDDMWHTGWCWCNSCWHNIIENTSTWPDIMHAHTSCGRCKIVLLTSLGTMQKKDVAGWLTLKLA